MVIDVTRDGWLEKVRGLQPTVEEWRDIGEQERRLPAALFDAIKGRGLFRLVLPTAFGGEQANLGTLVEVVEEISRRDGSVGWNLMIGSLGGCFADYLPEDVAQEILLNDQVAVGVFAPTGQAVRVEGGYRASGRWAFRSGCQNADWLTGGFLLMGDGKPRMNPDGSPDTQVMFFPSSECTILDTWHTAGMRGTGSHDYQVEDIFIPQGRGFPFSAFFRGPDERPSRGYTQPFLPHLVNPVMTAVSLGIAQDAIDSFKDLAAQKTPFASTSTLANPHTTHLRVGQAEALVRSARAYLDDIVRQVEAATSQTQEVVEELGAAVRLACAHCAQLASEAVDLMFDVAGGTSVYETSRLERCFRDVHMVSHHVLISPSNIEMVGQYLLGLGLQMRR